MSNWEQVKEIVATALERDQGERDSYVREACGPDAELRAEVESLLLNSEGASGVLKSPPPIDGLLDRSEAWIGRQLGAYRLMKVWGRGGMAVVYLAERADQQFRKRVAIKMVQPGNDNDKILRRFYNERQTLAALDHPNIVKLLDGGSSDDQLPYLVMEFVEGLPITDYCDAHGLGINQRLQLFVTVCRAVQHAHQSGVIHRDIKPSNILVTNDGTPRLLDFGIAKVLSPDHIQAPLVTRSEWRPMTPEYASPEQVRNDKITTISDVYSLGVLLYEMLTGHRPYPSALSLLEFEHLVCEQDADKPSTATTRVDKRIAADGTAIMITPESVSETRGLTPAALRRRLQGDLDTIVLKALSKEPERRYASAEEFAADIERHLAGMPIRARKPTLMYRTNRFVARHTEALTTAVVILVLVAMLSVVGVRHFWRLSLSGSSGSARRSVAVLGFRNLSGRPDTAWISTALAEMLSAELGAGEKLHTIPNETVSRTKIDLQLPDIDSLASDTLSRVHANLGSDYVVVGSYFDMGKSGGNQIRLDVRVQSAEKGDTVAVLSDTASESQLGDLVARTGAQLRQHFGIAPISESDLRGVQASVPSDQDALRLYAEGLDKLRSFDALAARDLLQRAVAADRAFPLAHSALSRAWQTLGYDANARLEAKAAMDLSGQLGREDRLLVEARYYEASRRWPKAIGAYQSLFKLFPDNLDYALYLAGAQTSGGKPKDALDTLASLSPLGIEVTEDPRVDLARSSAGAALGDNKLRRDSADLAAQKAERLGSRLSEARARAMECRALANLGENDRAKTICSEAVQIYSGTRDRGGMARALHVAMEVPLNQNDYDTAEKLGLQALALTREIGDEQGMGRELVNLGVIYKRRGQLDAARAAYDEAFQHDLRADDKLAQAAVMNNAGNVALFQGDLAKARRDFKAGLRIANEVGFKNGIGVSLESIGNVLFETGDLAGAYQDFSDGYDIHKTAGEPTYFAGMLDDLAKVLREQGLADEARSRYSEALALKEKLGNEGDASESRVGLGDLDCDGGNPSEGESLARKAAQVFAAERQTNNEVAADTVLIRALIQQGRLPEAGAVAASASRLAEQGHALFYQLPLELQRARLVAASHDFTGAERIAAQALSKAEKAGLVRMQLEASLTLGEIQLRGRNHAGSRIHLQQLAKQAHTKGFERIALLAVSDLEAKNTHAQ